MAEDQASVHRLLDELLGEFNNFLLAKLKGYKHI